MKLRILALLLCAAILAPALILPAAAQSITPATQADFDLPCQAAILVDLDTGTVLYEKNADEQRPIASITKVMTLLLTFQALEAGKVSLTDIVPVSEHAYGMGGSQIWLEPGEQMTLNDMLKAICISSANDAAVAVAEYIGGSEEAFVQQMNAEAARLGMTSTHFENACGLDEAGHLSTARDVSVMSREMLLHHTEIADYCTIWTDTLRGGETQLVNTNKLLKSYQGITATTLLDYGFANYQSLTAQLPEEAPETLPVLRGAEQTVELTYTAPGSVLASKTDATPLEVQLSLPESVEAPVTAGQKIGSVTILRGGEMLAEYPVSAANDVAALSFGLCFRRLFEALLLHG